MMKIFFLISILLILTYSVNADSLVQQIPDTLLPLGIFSQRDSVFPFNSEVCDDILITLDDWKLDSVTTWWLTGSGFVSWAEVSNIRLKIYPDSGISPPIPRDSAIYQAIIENSQISVIPVIQDIWRVTVELPDSFCLNFGQRYWLAIQPSNIFGTNGKTFWIADTGIGNGYPGYYRCSMLGYPQWTDLGSVFQEDYEMGLIIWGELVNQVDENMVEQLDDFTINSGYFDMRNSKLVFQLNLTEEANAKLTIRDISGRTVAIVDYGRLKTGIQNLEWLLPLEYGKRYSGGIFFYRLVAADHIIRGKFILVR